jgi:hypothetical protein
MLRAAFANSSAFIFGLDRPHRFPRLPRRILSPFSHSLNMSVEAKQTPEEPSPVEPSTAVGSSTTTEKDETASLQIIYSEGWKVYCTTLG